VGEILLNKLFPAVWTELCSRLDITPTLRTLDKSGRL